MSATTSPSRSSDGVNDHGAFRDYVTFVIANQLFGISVVQVRDVLSTHRITPIPLAPPEIAGSLNLRGRIVTVIDVRRRLGLKSHGANEGAMSIVVEHDQDLYSLVVDSVGEVLALGTGELEGNPPTLDPQFRAFSAGIHRLDNKLLVVLDVTRLLDYSQAAVA